MKQCPLSCDVPFPYSHSPSTNIDYRVCVQQALRLVLVGPQHQGVGPAGGASCAAVEAGERRPRPAKEQESLGLQRDRQAAHGFHLAPVVGAPRVWPGAQPDHVHVLVLRHRQCLSAAVCAVRCSACCMETVTWLSRVELILLFLWLV